MEQQQFQNRIIAISIIFSLVTGFIAGGVSSDLFSKIDWSAVPGFNKIIKNAPFASQSSILQSEISGEQEPVVQVAKAASPAVVSVIISKTLPAGGTQANPFAGTPFEQYFQQFITPAPSQGAQKQQIGGGSGFIVSSNGLILTNKHVVADTQADYSVLANDGQEYQARVLARDPVQDIAVLKIDKTGLPILKLGDSDKIEVGQSAIAIGNALAEFKNTVSLGVISGLGRSISAETGLGLPVEQLQNVIQTDAAINPGNSGGPLLNLSGEVVGINVAIAQGAQNIGFALPINLAKRDIDQLQKTGKISYPYLGVRYVMITSDIKQQNNLAVDYGALVSRGPNPGDLAVVPGSPADKAGILENDIILEVNGQKLDQNHALSQAIQAYNVGDTVTLKVLSKGQQKSVQVVLGETK